MMAERKRATKKAKKPASKAAPKRGSAAKQTASTNRASKSLARSAKATSARKSNASAQGVTAPKGFLAAAISAGLKKKTGDLDVALIVSTVPAQTAGVFTQTEVRAACVDWSEKLSGKGGLGRAVLINAGNANACTGKTGEKAVRTSADAVAAALGCKPKDVLIASTGPIGVPLPVEKLTRAVPKLARSLDTKSGTAAAKAIMTTDLVHKECAVSVRVRGATYTVGGMAKGSGMIHPNMATMLAVVTCDAPLTGAQAKRLLAESVAPTFNSISVDGDTSTNDSVFFLSNGAAGGHVSPHSPEEKRLQAAIEKVLYTLAEAIVVDGEGAKKLFAVTVKGAKTEADARTIARVITTSPLVKTAITGGDPNWGRIVAAAGRAGVKLVPTAMGLTIGGHVVARRGCTVPAGEKGAAKHLQQKRIAMELTVGKGPGKATALGCDLTYGYVDINAHYRT